MWLLDVEFNVSLGLSGSETPRWQKCLLLSLSLSMVTNIYVFQKQFEEALRYEFRISLIQNIDYFVQFLD